MTAASGSAAPGADTPRSIAVIGGSLAAVSAVRALRAQGFAGPVTVVSAEANLPYDRPPLSKAFLAGTASTDDLALLGADELRTATWRLGVPAVGLDDARVRLADGSSVPADGVVLATGARARLPWQHAPAGVHVLRTLADAGDLRGELRPGCRLVIVGAGFLGAEVASTAAALGVEVTLLDLSPVPLVEVLGAELARVLAARHAGHGVRLLAGVQVHGFTTGVPAAGAGCADARVSGVRLADGRVIAADAVLVAVGALPNVEWLAGSDIAIGDGVLCAADGATSRPGVVAVGDCAAWWDADTGRHRRVEHWTSARERAAVAVHTLLRAGGARHEPTPALRAPYVWSDQYGTRLQVVGHIRPDDAMTLEQGAADAAELLAVYRRNGVPVAVAAIGCARAFARWRKHFAAAAPPQAAATASRTPEQLVRAV